MKITHAFSDPHFGHRMIAKLRGFTNADGDPDTAAHDEELIERYSRVAEADCNGSPVVLWLGDCFFCPRERAASIMDALPGTKILVRGNHDWGRSPDWFAGIGFSLVLDGIVTLPPIAGRPVRACHLPYAGTAYGIEDADGNTKVDDQVLLHGHRYLDQRPIRRKGAHSAARQTGAAQIHVGVDAWGLRPVAMHEIEALIVGGKP